MRARGRCRHSWKSTECCEPAMCVVSKRDISLHNIQRNIWKIQDGGCWHVRFVAFVTILLNRPHRSRRFIYFKALFSCKKHQGKIYKTQRVLVANLATNFLILVASILVALATVLGAISCPEFYTLGVASKANTKEKVLINMSRISVTIPCILLSDTAADTWNRALGRILLNHSDFLKTNESH